MKHNNNIEKYIKEHKSIIIGASLIVFVLILCTGCIDYAVDDITGKYTTNDNTTLEIYHNNTFLYKEHYGYLMGIEISLTSKGTYEIKRDIVVFSADGVTTTGHIKGHTIVMEGSGSIYTKQQSS